MLINGRLHKVFEYKDLNSLISFDEWLKGSLSIYPDDATIPSAHLVLFLEYLRDTIYEQKIKDKSKWLKKIDSLIERAQQ